MGKKLTFLLLILMVLIALSAGYIVGGLQAYARYQQNSLVSAEHCGGESPVHICVQAPAAIFSAYYPYYVATQYPLFTITYSSSSNLTLIISVSVTGVSQVQAQTVNATNTTHTLSFVPPLLSQALRRITGEDSTSLHVQVADTAGHLYYLNDSPLEVHSRWLMQWLAMNRLKIAAWVTPNDPAIADLVAKAAKRLQANPLTATEAMVGYNKATPQQVIDQVNAIFDALRDTQIHYVQASVPYTGPGDTSASTENIKLPSEVLQQRSGMCIELTTLLASAAEHIGLHTAIIIVPGHAFLGVALTPDNQRFEYWDAVYVNDNIAGASANLATDDFYTQNLNKHTILDAILISDARQAGVGPML